VRAGTPRFIISSVTGRPGETVDVTVSAAQNPGLASLKLKLYFDNTKLEPVSITQGSALPVGNITSNVQGGGDLSGLDYVTAVWYNTEDVKINGGLFTVRFKVKDGAAPGATPLTLSYSGNDVTNQSGDTVKMVCLEGIVNIAEYVYGALFGELAPSGMSLVKLARFLAEAEEMVFPAQVAAADVYNDGVIDVRDLVKFAQYLAEWPDVVLGE